MVRIGFCWEGMAVKEVVGKSETKAPCKDLLSQGLSSGICVTVCSTASFD